MEVAVLFKARERVSRIAGVVLLGKVVLAVGLLQCDVVAKLIGILRRCSEIDVVDSSASPGRPISKPFFWRFSTTQYSVTGAISLESL